LKKELAAAVRLIRKKYAARIGLDNLLLDGIIQALCLHLLPNSLVGDQAGVEEREGVTLTPHTKKKPPLDH